MFRLKSRTAAPAWAVIVTETENNCVKRTNALATFSSKSDALKEMSAQAANAALSLTSESVSLKTVTGETFIRLSIKTKEDRALCWTYSTVLIPAVV